jgi:hypothetical protein
VNVSFSKNANEKNGMAVLKECQETHMEYSVCTLNIRAFSSLTTTPHKFAISRCYKTTATGLMSGLLSLVLKSYPLLQYVCVCACTKINLFSSMRRSVYQRYKLNRRFIDLKKSLLSRHGNAQFIVPDEHRVLALLPINTLYS